MEEHFRRILHTKSPLETQFSDGVLDELGLGFQRGGFPPRRTRNKGFEGLLLEFVYTPRTQTSLKTVEVPKGKPEVGGKVETVDV